jgi:SAM-dependent methyltransferase
MRSSLTPSSFGNQPLEPDYFETMNKSKDNWKNRKESGNYLNHAGGSYHQHRMEVCGSLIEESDLKDNKVLDFACGEGLFMEEMVARGANIVMGIDADQEMLEKAPSKLSQNPKVKLIKGDLNSLLSFPDNSLSLITAFSVTAYFTPEEDRFFYQQAHRLLRSNGILALSHSNLIFDFFSLNRFTVSTILENLIVNDHLTKAELESLLQFPEDPEGKASFATRENPLIYERKVLELGFREEKRVFANYHPVPPPLSPPNERANPNLKEFRNTLEWPEEDKWKLLFQCSIFASRLRKLT